jgi:hypothetical protein
MPHSPARREAGEGGARLALRICAELRDHGFGTLAVT